MVDRSHFLILFCECHQTCPFSLETTSHSTLTSVSLVVARFNWRAARIYHSAYIHHTSLCSSTMKMKLIVPASGTFFSVCNWRELFLDFWLLFFKESLALETWNKSYKYYLGMCTIECCLKIQFNWPGEGAASLAGVIG